MKDNLEISIYGGDFLYKHYDIVSDKTVIYDNASYMISVIDGKVLENDWEDNYLEKSIYDIEFDDEDILLEYKDLILNFKNLIINR